MSENRRLSKSAAAVGALTMVSRVMGFLRDAVVSHIFGAGAVTDAFNIAFTIPNLFRRLLAEGALSIALVPVFSGRESAGDRADSKRLYDATLGLMFPVLLLVTVAGVVFSPFVVRLFAPGFASGQFELAVFLNRVMFPYLLLVGTASFFVATLNARRSFAVPAASPVLLNLAIITCAVTLYSAVDPPILGLALGVVAGGLAQLALTAGHSARLGYRPSFRWEPRHPEVKRMLLLMLPATLGIAVYQVNVMVSRALASFLPKAAITYIYLSDRLLELPLGVFAVAVATVSLPALSAMSAAGDMKGFRNTLSFAVRLSMFVCIPAMAGLMVLRVPVVSLLFQHGAFTSKNTVECAAVVLTALAGLWAIAGTRNLAQAFYAMNDTATPVKTAFAAFALNVLCSLFLMGPLGAPGLTLANSISSIFNFAVLSMALSRKIGGWDGTEAAKSAARSLAAAAIMAAAVHPFSTLDLWLEGGRYLVKGGVLASAIALGCVVYAAASWTMGGRELRSLLERFGGKSPGNR